MTKTNRYQLAVRVRRPSLGRLSQPGEWGACMPEGKVFGEDEYSNYEHWARIHSNSEREYAIMPHSGSDADED
jgi:hypothetical protein